MIIPQAIHSYSCTLKPVQDCDMDIIKEWLIAYHIEALGDDADNPTLEQSIIDEIQDTNKSLTFDATDNF